MLVLSADTRHTTRLDLAAIGDVAAQRLGILVVDELDLVLAERTILATRARERNQPWFLLTDSCVRKRF